MKFRYPESTKIDLTRPSLIEIGDNVDINANFTIMTHDFGTFVFRNLYNDFVASSGKVTIGNNIYIGRNVTILKGVTIGDNCIIGLGSIVTKDIPKNSVVAGIPAKVICDIDSYYQSRKLKQVEESIAFGISIVKNFYRTPVIYDFIEEWTVFVTKEDLKKYPNYNSIIKFRLKDKYEQFMKNHQPYFNGFEEFKNEIMKRIQ